jgi:hypothetical protein
MKIGDRNSKFLSRSTLQKNIDDSIENIKDIPQLQTQVDCDTSPNMIKKPEFTPVHKFGLSNVDAESSNVVIHSVSQKSFS